MSEDDELARKRTRNRLAQQKYRKKLKSHIEELEKKAAAAEQITKNSMSDQASSFAVGLLPRDGSDAANFVRQMGHVPTASIGGDATTLAPRDFSIAAPSSVNPSLDGSSSYGEGLGYSGEQSLPTPPDMLLYDLAHMEIPRDNFESAMDLGRLTAKTPSRQEPSMKTLNSRFPQPSRQNSTSLMSSPPPPSQRATLPDKEQSNLDNRVDYVLQSVQRAGFDTVDSFMTYYYTASFKDRPDVKTAQTASRCRGLPEVLDCLRTRASSWSSSESSGYRNAIVSSAAHLILDEFNRLAKKRYNCEEDLLKQLTNAHKMPEEPSNGYEEANLLSTATELKQILQDELPVLDELTENLAAAPGCPQMVNLRNLLATMQVITASDNELLQEAVNWVCSRENPAAMPRTANEPTGDIDYRMF